MKADVHINLTQIWDDTEGPFSQSKWGELNYFIGPNGSGKTLFAEELENQFQGHRVRFLSAERLTGLEPGRYQGFYRSEMNQGINLQNEERYFRVADQGGLSSDAYLMLRDRADLRVKIQAILSQFFNREIELTVEGGYLSPQMRDLSSSANYDLQEDESHGLKELISLLAIIHNEKNDILIIDEPELHLHPQYQKFLLQEIRRLAGPPNQEDSRTFFLITHSPTMIGIRDLNDLKNIYSFRDKSKHPYSVDSFEIEDRHHINKLIPRLSARHKEVLFSKRPVLVEGYTDEEIFSLTIEKHDQLAMSPESELMGVGGKERLNSFYRFCRGLGLQPRIICDLDTLFEGNLRQTLSESHSVNRGIRDRGLGPDLMNAIGDVETNMTRLVRQIESYSGNNEDLLELKSELTIKEIEKQRYLLYRFIKHDGGKLGSELNSNAIDSISGRVNQVLNILASSGYHVLEQGDLEDYLRDDSSPFPVSKARKRSLFDEKRDQLLGADNSSDVSNAVGAIVPLLQQVTATQTVDLINHLEQPISDWIYDLQWEVRKGTVETEAELRDHSKVGKNRYGHLFSIENFEVESTGEDSEFRCKIKLLSSLDPDERTYEFDQDENSSLISLK